MKVDLLLADAEIICVTDEEMSIQRHASIAIADGLIVYVGTSFDGEATRVIDMRGHMLMPGMVNLHTHLPMTLLRGIAEGVDLQGFLERVWAEEARVMDPTGTRIGTQLGALEALLGGTTTALDMYFHPDAAHRGAVDVGLRHVIGPVFFSFPGPDNLTWEQRLVALEQWPETLAQIGGPYVPLALMPHAPLTVAPADLRQLAELAKKHGFLINTHASENIQENDDTLAAYGSRPVHILRESGVLDLKPVLAHGVQVDVDERAVLAQYGASVAHCPGSNLKLASGALDWVGYREAGVLVGLGTDGCSSSNDLDMFPVMRMASNLSRLVRHDPKASDAAEMVKAATVNGARALGMGDRIGTIEVGKEADIIAIDLDAPHFVPLHDPYTAVVFSAGRADVSDVFVAGEQVIAGRRSTRMDHQTIFDAARRHVGDHYGEATHG
jgi:5-methylthioadenosine/S-adenosylhomocysteine deaminase